LNTTYLLGALLAALGLNILVAMYAILWRHAIPRAPWYFRLSVVPGVVGGLSALVLARLFVTSGEGAFGFDAIALAAIFVASQTLTWLSLNLYAVWWYFRGRDSERTLGRDTNMRVRRVEGIVDERLERMDASEDRRDAVDRKREEADERREKQDRHRRPDG